MRRCVSVCAAFALLSALLSATAQGEPMWPTYNRDAQRSGYDPEATKPLGPAFAWQTADLGAPIWSQPLVVGERVYVATVGDEVYALEASTGEIVWKKSVGTPVPSEAGSNELPCGDIEPTVGVVGTPVIDPSTQVIYMVADTWDAATREIHHMLEGLSLANGDEVIATNVDPPGADPTALLQRTALNLDGNEVIFGYGGNDGDCSDYRGTVVEAPMDGGTPRFWQYDPAEPSSSGGAVWAPAGPPVDGSGYVYATTGNPDPPAGKTAETYDYSDSVLKLDPRSDFVAAPATKTSSQLGWFKPPNWEEESNDDLDLSSAAAELLAGGVLFQAGKDGNGYLIDEQTMNSGAEALYSHEVCFKGGSFGGDSYAGGVIYIPCEDGVEALAYSEADHTFTSLWHGPYDAVGPPILSGGLVWTIATGGFSGKGKTLYGLDPTTGLPRYTETLPSAVIDHFASPSAAGGRLFVATGSSVSAYQIAELTPGEISPPAETVKKVGGGSLGTTTSNGSTGATAIADRTPFPKQGGAALLHTHLHSSKKGRVRVLLRCPQSSPPCQGTVTLAARFHAAGKHGSGPLVAVKLATVRFGPARGSFGVTVQLNSRATGDLRHHKHHLSLRVTIATRSGPTLTAPGTLT